MPSARLGKLLSSSSTKIAVLTGAGVSQESGVPTFRDKDGLWQKFRPEELANMDAFLRNPKLVWEWYEHRRHVLRDVRPNAGHLALVGLAQRFPDFTLVTQNVDGLHTLAGQNRVLELHGNIRRSRCVGCNTFATDSHLDTGASTCTRCGANLRPDVVWFGEVLPEPVLRAAQWAAETCDLFLSVGTSGAVYPAAALPLIAKESGAYVVEINPQPSELSPHMDEVLSGPSAKILPELLTLSSSNASRSP